MHLTKTERRRPTGSGAAALAVVIGLLLGGCAEPGAPEEPDGSAAPSASAASATASPSPAASTSEGPAATPTPTPHESWGAYATRAEACSAVADELLGLALLPTSLSGNPDPEQLQAVEDRVEQVRAAAPPGLAADLARVQLLIDSYGEALTEDPGAEFDGEALDEALTPVRTWLDETCRETG